MEYTVMECTEYAICNDNVRDSIIHRYTKCRRKITRLEVVCAGLIVCFVPSVLCDSDWSRSLHHLSYDEIYNETHYAQLRHVSHIPRPYNIPEFSFKPSHSYSLDDDVRANELEEYNYRDNTVKEPLLVGFAHDPFRYSVPEDDYLNGVRNMNPKAIMSKGENRGKRGVLHLYNMMYCATGCEPLAYKGYGCYCGFLGSGRPTDGIDRCCKLHDECYENIYCPFFTVYFQPYYWKCYRGEPLCALENYDTQHQFINGCAARLCECDRKFAMCVKKYPCPRRRALCHSSPIRLLQNLLMFR